MSDIVEIGLEVHIDAACLPACTRLGHALHGGVRRPFRAIAIRARLTIRLKNGLEDQFQGSRHHTVADGRNPEDADLCPAVLWYLLSVAPAWVDTCVRPVRPVSAQETALPHWPRCPQTLPRQSLGRRGWPWPFSRPLAGSPCCSHGRTGPRTARTVQPSPSHISSVAGLADSWAPLSSRPRLPCLRGMPTQ